MRKTRKIKLGTVEIGGGSPVSVQSMTTTRTEDSAATIAQIHALESRGCEIVRLAVPNMAAAETIGKIVQAISIPVVADIHFSAELALESIRQGVHGIRINPGNIGSLEKTIKVIDAVKEKNIPVRIGVNSGSLEKEYEEKYGRTPQAIVESALAHVRVLENADYRNIKISVKSSDIGTTIKSYELLSEKVDYPLHLGLTEAGTAWSGTIKSSIAMGYLLYRGIGDTIRVSLSGDPCREIDAGFEILKHLGLRRRSPVIIACPTCGRCELSRISKIAEEIEQWSQSINSTITIAVMGCEVNGPGEASDADIGIAGAKGYAVLFKNGEKIRKIPEDRILEELKSEILAMTNSIVRGGSKPSHNTTEE